MRSTYRRTDARGSNWLERLLAVSSATYSRSVTSLAPVCACIAPPTQVGYLITHVQSSAIKLTSIVTNTSSLSYSV